VIQINGSLLILCHQRNDKFSVPTATISVWRQGSALTCWGADSAPPDPTAGYRGWPLGRNRREGVGGGRVGVVGVGRDIPGLCSSKNL